MCNTRGSGADCTGARDLADPMHDPNLSTCPCGCGLTMQLPPTEPLDDTAPSVVPRTVDRDELMAALEPLYLLLGIPAGEGGMRTYGDPGLLFENDTVTVTLAGHVITAAAARSVVVGDEPFAEWATEVKVLVR
jgi:hypothetical protein